MTRKDYYAILGVPRSASARGIREAYRRLAKKLHPDKVGPGGTRSFQEVAEAYETLSDTTRREDYNRELDLTAPGPDAVVVEPVSRRRDDLRRFAGRRRPVDDRTLNLELVLSPGEARAGGVVEFGVPVLLRCPRCGGSGGEWPFPCVVCARRGVLEGEYPMAIVLPETVRTGAILEVPMPGRCCRLRLRLRVVGQVV